MINEHKANASFMIKIVILLISYWIASTLAVIIYSMFYDIDTNTLLAYILFPTPIIWFVILIGMGLIYRWMGYLNTYDRHKLWCIFVKELIMTILATILATLTTIELYQIEHPVKPIKIMLITVLLLIIGFLIIATLTKKYLKILKNLKKIDKN